MPSKHPEFISLKPDSSKPAGANGIGMPSGLGDAVLPVELAAVVVVAAALDALEPRRPRAHPSEAVGETSTSSSMSHIHVGAELVGDAHALAEAAGPAGVGVQPAVDEFGAEPVAEGLDDLGRVVDGRVVDDRRRARASGPSARCSRAAACSRPERL